MTAKVTRIAQALMTCHICKQEIQIGDTYVWDRYRVWNGVNFYYELLPVHEKCAIEHD